MAPKIMQIIEENDDFFRNSGAVGCLASSFAMSWISAALSLSIHYMRFPCVPQELNATYPPVFSCILDSSYLLFTSKFTSKYRIYAAPNPVRHS